MIHINDAWLKPAWTVVWCVVWIYICLGLSRKSGWREMAERFKRTRPPANGYQWFVPGRIGTTRHGGTLRLGFDDQGLHLAVLAPFRLGHPPLHIPWSQIHSVQDVPFLRRKGVRFAVGHPAITTILLPVNYVLGTRLDPSYWRD